MENSDITCERVEHDGLDTRYLRGDLPEDVAEAFEAHFFGCDHCWTLVHGGIAASAAMSDAPAIVPHRLPVHRPSWRRIGGWAAVASIAAFVLLRVADRTPREPVRTPAVMRGTGSGFAATVTTSCDSVIVNWARQPSAVRYRLTIFSATGNALMTTDASASRWSLNAASLGRLARGTTAWLRIEALDSLDLPVGTSPITKLPVAGAGR
jgi:anti-sigma factor RsiW